MIVYFHFEESKKLNKFLNLGFWVLKSLKEYENIAVCGDLVFESRYGKGDVRFERNIN